MTPTRREVLGAGAGATAGALAGCLGTLGLRDDTADGYAAFFSLYDWATAVGGTELELENPVGIGEMGHGWSPDGDIAPSIANTDLFLYLRTAEFQWAVNAADTLARDHNDEVRLVDLLDGIEPHLLPVDGGADPPTVQQNRTFDREELLLDEFEVWDPRTDDQLGWWHFDHWHLTMPEVAIDDEVPVRVVVPSVEDETVAASLGDDSAFDVDARVAEGADEDLLAISADGDRVLLAGQSVGQTELVFEIYEDGALIYETVEDPAAVTVVESYDEDPTPDAFDPHAWVDPVLAQDMVDTIAEELAAHDPDNAETYRENAAGYQEDLAAVDRAFERLVEDAELDVAIFASHDSFQYIEHRYGLDLVTPTGISPDEAATFGDISGLVETIEANGIDTVLYDPFEAARPGEDLPQLVEALLENSHADNARMLTPVEGVTEEWAEDGWGWVEQMEEVNLPSLQVALNPSQ